MSETIPTQDEGDTPEPVATETEAPAPAAEGAADTETTDQPKPSRGDRRFAALSARLSAAEQREARQAAEIEALRSGRTPQTNGEQPHLTPEQQTYLEQRVAAEVAHRAAQDRAQRFHAEGRAQHADWQERCSNLMQMGADAKMAELLIEMPDGVKVAAALADDPEELERIAGLQTERARAIELGKYAAAKVAQAPAPRMSRAPPPIRPVTGSVNPTFNEYTASADQLAEYYAKQARERRMGR